MQPEAELSPPTVADETSPRRSLAARLRSLPWQVVSVWIALVLLVAVGGVLNDRFLTPVNLFNVLRQASMIGIIALGMTFVIVSGGIDLSVGSLLALVGVASTTVLASGHGLLPALMFGLLVGTVGGALQGAGIALFRIPPFIMTLAGMTIFRGAALLWTSGKIVSVPMGEGASGGAFNHIANGFLFGVVPYPVILMLVLFAGGHVLLNHTRFGVHVLAVGGSEEAARLSGVRVGLVKALVYTLCGACTAIAAIVESARLTSGNPTAGTMYELDAIAAVVIGGTALSGGKGGVWGTLGGVLLLFVLLNLFNMMNVSFYFQQVFKGFIIIGAVLLQYRRRD